MFYCPKMDISNIRNGGGYGYFWDTELHIVIFTQMTMKSTVCI